MDVVIHCSLEERVQPPPYQALLNAESTIDTRDALSLLGDSRVVKGELRGFQDFRNQEQHSS